MALTAPILIIGFKRPDFLAQLLESLSNLGARRIYLSIDGARLLLDYQAVEKCKSLSLEFAQNNSHHEVFINFNSTNLGCKNAVFHAIDWFFRNEDSGIILEDDIIPSQAFFEYCDLGLSLFRDDPRIWQLNGWTPLDFQVEVTNFYITRHAHVWGWATWKDRWLKIDRSLHSWQSDVLDTLEIFSLAPVHPDFKSYWNNHIGSVKAGNIDTWDAQWLFSMWINNMFALSPDRVLCGNVGFDSRATHTANLTGPIITRLPRRNSIIRKDQLLDFNTTLANDLIHDVDAHGLQKLGQESISEPSKKILNYSLSNSAFSMSKPFLCTFLQRIKSLSLKWSGRKDFLGE